MSRRRGRICPRCNSGTPCPSVKVGENYIHAGCRTEQERKAMRRRPFPPFKRNGRRNRSSVELMPTLLPALTSRAVRHRHLPEDLENPLDPQPTPGVGPQPWHADAIYFREEEGQTVRQCAKLCGVSFGTMQRFLNPQSKAKAKAKQAEIERHKRHTDPEHLKRTRDYHRRYHQAVERRAP